MPSLTCPVPFDGFEIHSKSRSPQPRVGQSSTFVPSSSIVYILGEVNRVAFLVFKTSPCVPAYGSLSQQRHGHCLLSLEKERLYLQGDVDGTNIIRRPLFPWPVQHMAVIRSK
ncbi:unnamed protein product [Adineta ricciae]|nr:unnamed protein product [Adineta ricciae]